MFTYLQLYIFTLSMYVCMYVCIYIYIYIYVHIHILYSHYIQNYHKGIDDWKVTLFEKCETLKQLRERETFWQHKLKIFYPLGLNEIEEYLF